MPPSSQPPPTRLALVFYGYILVFQVLLAAVLFHLYGDAQAPLGGLLKGAIAPHGWSDPVTLGAYLVGFGAVALAIALPPKLARRAAIQPGPGRLVPYLVRLCLLEIGALAGFGLAVLSGAILPALPLAAVGLAGTLLSAPRSAVLNRGCRTET